MSGSNTLLGSEGLTLAAAGRTLVHALDWQVLPGQRWCVIGRNAAGKSSLLRALAGVGEVGVSQRGVVRWQGRPQRDWAAVDAAALRAFMPQQAVDRFPISVARLLELSVVRARHDAQAVLAALDIAPLAARPVLELSGGERQRGVVRWQGRPQRDWAAVDAAALRAFMPQQAVDRFPISVARLLELSVVRPRHDAQAVLAALDIAPLAARPVLELSGGERQRVALAQAVLQGAPLLLLDEPVAFQDPAHQALVARWLAGALPPDQALVISAHDVNWIARVATHVLALLPGGRSEQGPAPALLCAALLERVYGCAWREVGGVWIAD